MKPKCLPVHYRMKIYVDSFVSNADATFEGSTPFMAVHVGDQMNPSSWPNARFDRSKIAMVKAVRHYIWEIETEHIMHSIQVCVAMSKNPD